MIKYKLKLTEANDLYSVWALGSLSNTGEIRFSGNEQRAYLWDTAAEAQAFYDTNNTPTQGWKPEVVEQNV